MYRVTMMVGDYILLTLFLKFHNVAPLLCNFCVLPHFQLPKQNLAQWYNQDVVNKSESLTTMVSLYIHPVAPSYPRGRKILWPHSITPFLT